MCHSEPYSPLFLAAYKVEAELETSLPAVRTIAEVHRRYQAPATFFITAALLEAARDEYRAIFEDELFDLQSYADIRLDAAHSGLDELREQIELSQRLLADTFGCEVVGLALSTPEADGLSGQKQLLNLLWENGIRFVRSDRSVLTGTSPGPFTQPYWYGAYGYGSLLELPLQYWDDRILRGHIPGHVAWPPILPWGVPPAPPVTPEEEFEIWRWGADYVSRSGLRVYEPVFHPWSVCRLSSEARQIDLLLHYLRDQGFEVVSCFQLYERAREGRETFSNEKVKPLPVQQCTWRRPSILSDGNHDARAPLHPIVGFAELLSIGAYGPLNEKQQKAADEILQCAERLAYVLEELVVAEKLSARRVEVHLEPTSVEALARQVCAEAEILSQGRATVQLYIEPGAEAVLTDEERLLELIACLLRNAIAFHPGDPKIEFAARRVGDRLRLQVADDGPGIPAHLGVSAFRPLVREGDPHSALPEGIGLGLTIASALAHLLGGQLRLKRTDTGTVFDIDLPAAEPPSK